MSHPEVFDDERGPAPVIYRRAMTLKRASQEGFSDATRRLWRDIIASHPWSVVT